MKPLCLLTTTLWSIGCVSSFVMPKRHHFRLSDTSTDLSKLSSLYPNHLATESPVHRLSATSIATEAPPMSKVKASLTKFLMMSFLTGMCLSLTVTLLPQRLLFGLLGERHRIRKEKWALATGQWCARWMLRIFPFCDLSVQGLTSDSEPEPCIWVCNHTSMLDVFILLAADRKLRGRRKRPIKIVYWRGLEANPFTWLLFTQSGFISVDMADNGNGNANEYDKSTFKRFLKDCKQAFSEGFDVGILPEGQLNPTPEKGLLPVFGGAFTLAKLSKRPIGLFSLWGLWNLWHPKDGMTVRDRRVLLRAYPHRVYSNADEFLETFNEVVGHFSKTGQDLPDWESRLAPSS